jgi:hypothetical protein
VNPNLVPDTVAIATAKLQLHDSQDVSHLMLKAKLPGFFFLRFDLRYAKPGYPRAARSKARVFASVGCTVSQRVSTGRVVADDPKAEAALRANFLDTGRAPFSINER